MNRLETDKEFLLRQARYVFNSKHRDSEDNLRVQSCAVGFVLYLMQKGWVSLNIPKAYKREVEE